MEGFYFYACSFVDYFIALETNIFNAKGKQYIKHNTKKQVFISDHERKKLSPL